MSKKTARIIAAGTLAIALVALLSGIALGTTLKITLKDGTVVQYDTGSIKSMEFIEGPGSGASSASNAQQWISGTPFIAEEFDGPLGSLWERIEVIGGNFGKFAKIANGELTIVVPPGNSWGKTGIMTAAPAFTVDAGMSAKPVRMLVEFNPDQTENVLIGLAESKNPDMWLLQNVWAAMNRNPGANETQFALLNTQGEPGTNPGSVAPGRPNPRFILLSVWPGKVELRNLETNESIMANFPWIRVGSPIYFYIFSHPWAENGPAKMSVKSIRFYK